MVVLRTSNFASPRVMAPLSLQSQDHRDLLDTVDKLRAEGVSRYVDLPQIIVCGDQSAGKSSVLEAISGMSFPTKDNLCTRFATELILRRDAKTGMKASIIPGSGRLPEEIERLSSFSRDDDGLDLDVGRIVEGAKDAMGLSDTKVFSSDTLRIELCGPTQPHLTMVDLPGLFRASNMEQSSKDAKIVSTKVRAYMKSARSIILCVVSAKSDFALQEVTELARELDPKGMRTLGLITKPDTLDAGSDSETSYVRLAQNQDVYFRLGWHVLKNRSYDMRNASSAERDRAEENFFATGAWTAVDPLHLGVKPLKSRLSRVLGDHILHQLPSLIADVEGGIASCHTQLRRLGPPRNTLEEQRRYLLGVSRVFSRLMTAALEGFYNDPFFGSATTDAGYEKRLRAVVQNTLADFSDRMRGEGQAKIIVEMPEDGEELSLPKVSRSDYINEVRTLMRRSRGCELPGTFNPLIIGELFKEQCQPWRYITSEAKDSVLQAVYRTTQAILKQAAVDQTFEETLKIINRRIDELQKDVDAKIVELLDPHYSGHPITYNHYLTDNVQHAQAQRNKRRLEQALKTLFGHDSLEGRRVMQFDCSVLLTTLDQHTEPNMDRFASELAVDYMQAYYKVALKKFVDDVSVLAIEECLIQKLPDLFGPELVYSLNDNDIVALAADCDDIVAERLRCQERLNALELGLRELKRLDNKHPALIPDNGDLDTPRSSSINEDHDNEAKNDSVTANADDVQKDKRVEYLTDEEIGQLKPERPLYVAEEEPVEEPAASHNQWTSFTMTSRKVKKRAERAKKFDEPDEPFEIGH